MMPLGDGAVKLTGHASLPVLEHLAHAFVEVFRARQDILAEAFARTGLPGREAHVEALLHYLYTAAVRMARERLEQDGTLPPWPEHRDGSRWIWRAEKP